MKERSAKKSSTPPPPSSHKGPERRRPVLIVQHAPHEHPAALLRALETQGIQTHWIHPYRGEPYPAVETISGIVSLGGPMGANDQEHQSWIRKEMELFRRCVDARLPTVGICLGGQILARALGGRVEKHSTAEVGWFPVQLNEEGLKDPIVGAAGPSPTVYHWHMDTFFPPEGARILASSRACPRQAYTLGDSVYGFQFHPEADHQLVLEWLAVEGTEDDISAAQKEHGKKTVQGPRTQRNHALKGEKGSLKITTAISSLFRKQRYARVIQLVHEEIAKWTTQRTLLDVEFENPSRKITSLRGTISTLLEIPSGQYIIFQTADEGAALWPIRFDDIRGIKPAG